MKWIKSIILSIPCFLLLTGCYAIDLYQKPMPIQKTEYETTAAITSTVTEATTTTTTTIFAPTYPEKVVQAPVSLKYPVDVRVQAEDCKLSEWFQVDTEYSGYTGSGYVVGLSGDLQNTICFTVNVPASQHYDVSAILEADSDAVCTLQIDDEMCGTLEISGTGHFIQATIKSVYLEAGTKKITVQQISGDAAIDCILLQNSNDLKIADVSNTLCDVDATEETQKLMRFLQEQYGEHIISGQYVSNEENTELTEIYKITGQLPVIRFSDLFDESGNDTAAASLKWSNQGGIVGLIWNWKAPTGKSSIYSEETDFSLWNAITNLDIATCSFSEIQQMKKDGLITEDCEALIRDIDKAAKALKKLQSQNVPVLWRPLQEASNGWYWWGSAGSDAYQWLWNLLYTRLTEYHELHNLIWIWNGQSESYTVPETQYDIASADIYLDATEKYSSRYEQFYGLQKIAANKIVALSECSTIPDLTDSLRDNAMWSFFGLWYGEYLMDDTTGYTTRKQMIEAYNSNVVLTLSKYLAWYAPLSN